MEKAFSKDEFDRRIEAVRKQMAARNIDVLVDSNPCNLYYLTGYDAMSYYVPQAAVVFQGEGSPMWFGRLLDAPGVPMMTHLAESDILTFADDYVQAADRHPMTVLGAYIEERIGKTATIGIDNDCYYFTPRSRDALMARLPDARYLDVDNLVNWVRLIKSDVEINVLRKAAKIGEEIIDTFFNVVEPGVRHCDAAAAVQKKQTGGTPDIPGDYGAAPVMMPKGDKLDIAHLCFTEEPFATGEATYLETAGVYRKYHCPIARTIYLGQPPQKMVDAAKGVAEGIDVSLAAAKAGNTAEDVESAWRKVIARHGLDKITRLGYSIGIAYPPDWGEHTVSLRPGDKTVLANGMCFHLMTGIWMNGWGIEITEPFLVTASGGEPFMTLPRALHIKN